MHGHIPYPALLATTTGRDTALSPQAGKVAKGNGKPALTLTQCFIRRVGFFFFIYLDDKL